MIKMNDMVKVEMDRKYFKELIEDNMELIDRLMYVKDLDGNTLKVILRDNMTITVS